VGKHDLSNEFTSGTTRSNLVCRGGFISFFGVQGIAESWLARTYELSPFILSLVNQAMAIVTLSSGQAIRHHAYF
jgi:hypothetical protein